MQLLLPCFLNVLFQFHNGTINTINRMRAQRGVFCFNSTTVQLIHALLHNNALNIGSFNSTTVQLILLFHRPKSIHVEFQFHNGTINTKSIAPSDTLPRVFQFHNGTINTKLQPNVLTHPTVFQFHNGTINTIRKETKKSLKHVSIPQRYN